MVNFKEPLVVSSLEVRVDESTFVQPAGPVNGRPLFLNNIEQVLAFPVETVYFYGPNPDKSNETVAEVVKEALGKALVTYNFAAGRLRLNEEEGRLEIDCNGAGAQFAAATCDRTIADLGDYSHPNSIFRKLVLQAANSITISDMPLLLVQVTRFKCGGFTVGFGMSHLLWDGPGAIDFLTNLTSFAKGGELVLVPQPDRTMLKARSPPTPVYDHPEFFKLSNLQMESGAFRDEDFTTLTTPRSHVTRVFNFSIEDLEVLKKKALAGDGSLRKCSTFEALSAHLWQARTKSIVVHPGPTGPSNLLFSVDIRKRLIPNLPEHFCGNATWSACARATAQELCEKSLCFCVEKVQDAIATITDDYVRSGLDWWEVYRGFPALPGAFFISSWSRMSFHSIDFGWGRPLYAGPPCLTVVDFVLILANGAQDKGLHIIIALEAEQMAKFEDFIKV